MLEVELELEFVFNAIKITKQKYIHIDGEIQLRTLTSEPGQFLQDKHLQLKPHVAPP